MKKSIARKQDAVLSLIQCEMAITVAGCVDDLCFVHSMHGTNPAPGGAMMKLHTGSDNFVRPSMGSWVSYGLGTENSGLPAFVTICPTLAFGGINNWSSAFLPATYQGTAIGNASIPSEKAQVKFIRNSRLSREMQQLQLQRLEKMNRDHMARSGAEASLEARLKSFELAFRMQSELPRVEDLSTESAATHRLYGRWLSAAGYEANKAFRQ